MSSVEGGQMYKKSLKELCTMRDALKDLLEHQNWLGSEIILEETLKKVLERIEDTTGENL